MKPYGSQNCKVGFKDCNFGCCKGKFTKRRGKIKKYIRSILRGKARMLNKIIIKEKINDY